MKDPKYAGTLLVAAEKDFTALENMTNQALFAEEIFGFHAQQSVEKSLKALISFHGLYYPKTHAIDTLFKILTDNIISLPENYMDFLDLNEYAVEYRYDVYSISDQFEFDREQIIRKVGELLKFVKTVIYK